MKSQTEKIVNKYLNFGGNKNYNDFSKFLKEILDAKYPFKIGAHDYKLLDYVQNKIIHGMQISAEWGTIYVMVDEESIQDIEDAIEGSLEGVKNRVAPVKKTKAPKNKKRKDLGKVVDRGEEVPGGKSDEYWKKKKMHIVFEPNDEKVRVGSDIPSSYKYDNIRFLESYYGLKAIEFGNWLSQQDRANYLAGFGMALYDLHELLGFNPKQIGLKNKLAVAFGARGHGAALAHFENATFAINLTRYSRPKKVALRPKNFKRADLIIENGNGGGVGAFAHEYAHALDFFAGQFIEKTEDVWQISGGKSIETNTPKGFTRKLQVLMSNLLNKIIWKSKNIHTDYYIRLKKATKKKYYIQRNEIWARSFEIYVQYKLAKQKHKNIFLNEPKYSERIYLTFPEMKKLESNYDALIEEIKRHL